MRSGGGQIGATLAQAAKVCFIITATERRCGLFLLCKCLIINCLRQIASGEANATLIIFQQNANFLWALGHFLA